MRLINILFILLSLGVKAQFGGPGGTPGSKSVHKDDGAVVSWATAVKIERGWWDAADTSLGKASAGKDSFALGAMDGKVVSLGDGGVATLFFATPVVNRNGYDFAVFENGFKVGLSYFLELAHVEVSKNGVDYFRFPSESHSDTSFQTSSFGYTAPEKLYNLAGKHQAPYGSLFDLNEVGLDTAYYVRLVDVVGSIADSVGTRDSKQRIINDPYPTDFESGGFDLDAVALVNGMLLSVPNLTEGLALYPNSVRPGELVHLANAGGRPVEINIIDQYGRVVLTTNQGTFSLEMPGYYTVQLSVNTTYQNIKLCVY